MNNIRSVAQSFGSVKLFKAYLEVTEQVPVSRTVVLRSELQSSGVSLTDCPHNGRKDVADKMIIGIFTLSLHNPYVLTISQSSVDMLAYAMDNPAPSTIVLISGDRDFAYALSLLRLRRYRVVLITLPNAHQSLRAQASISFDWASEVLEPIDPTLPTSPRHRKISSPPAQDKFYPDFIGHNPPSSLFQGSYDEKSASSVEFMNDFRDETRGKEISQILPEHDARHDSLLLLERQRTASSIATAALNNCLGVPARVMHPSVASCHTYINESIQTSVTAAACSSESDSSRSTLNPNTSVACTPKVATHGNIASSRSSTHSALREAAVNSPNLSQHKVPNVIRPTSIESTMQMLHSEIVELRESSPFHQQGSHPPDNVRSLSSIDPVADDDDRPAHSDTSPPANVAATLTAPAPSLAPPSLSISNPTVSAIVQISANPRRLTPSVVVPDKFKILIKCLKSHRSRGSLSPLRSKISSEFAENGATYRQAGVSTFGGYVAIAEKEGIVELGGSGLTAWISLKAPWYNARLS